MYVCVDMYIDVHIFVHPERKAWKKILDYPDDWLKNTIHAYPHGYTLSHTPFPCAYDRTRTCQKSEQQHFGTRCARKEGIVAHILALGIGFGTMVVLGL
jgi:hypothetical protein